MGKIADRYLKGDGWHIIEEGFSAPHNEVSESIFSIGNEFTGARGFAEEGTDCKSLNGIYFNGIYECEKNEGTAYKGIVQKTHFMVNCPNWLFVNIYANDEKVILTSENASNFIRDLNMQNGVYTRSYIWKNSKNQKIKFTFTRFLEMNNFHRGWQKISAESVDFEGELKIISGTDINAIHAGRKKCYWKLIDSDLEQEKTLIVTQTKKTKQNLCLISAWNYSSSINQQEIYKNDFIYGKSLTFNLKKGQSIFVEKAVTFSVDRDSCVPLQELKKYCLKEFQMQCSNGYELALKEQTEYWNEVWNQSDIQIEGDELDQQGIRFCIFQMNQTYHGISPKDNIGAKGLTGEAYNGHAFWDTETYCLPFYLYSNMKAAKNLLEFRYSTLEQAKKRAKMLDCRGACYPVATLNGDEACNLWQHASLQFQPSTAVAYGIAHYFALTNDTDFLYEHGIEMLVEITRFLVSRGAWNQNHTGFGFYAVMGPDEFHMMVNNNCYTNFMAKKTFDYTLNVLQNLKKENLQSYNALIKKTLLKQDEIDEIKLCSEKMILLFDSKTNLYEQHEGYFSMPHIDVNKIPVEDFPLYGHWSYDRIYRSDMIKQPDVLMFLFLYRNEFSKQILKANYDYYEPRTIHESSLSPSVHSVLACDLKKYKEASRFFGFATRLDLDNYNRNTREGLHTTSIAAAWINIVFGFGGLHSEPEMGECLSIAPVLPDKWTSYSFNFIYKNALINILVTKKYISLHTKNNVDVELVIYGKKHFISSKDLKIPLEEM